jgi:hypothetical protein
LQPALLEVFIKAIILIGIESNVCILAKGHLLLGKEVEVPVARLSWFYIGTGRSGCFFSIRRPWASGDDVGQAGGILIDD